MSQLLCSILQCGFLDVRFLESLINEFNLELDYEDIIANYGGHNINFFIYEAYEQVKNLFIEANQSEIISITEKSDPYDLDYTIFTNYLDSHLWFNNQEIEELFQKWRDTIK